MKFLLKTDAAAWGMDNFNEYLNGSTFTLYRDSTTKTTLGTTQMKTLNRLQTTMNDHNFKIKDIQKSDLPNSLRKGQNMEKLEPTSQNKTFNKSVHVDTINTHTKPGKTIISIMDDSRTFATSAVIPDSRPDLAVSATCNYWCKPYGFPETISFKQGKVQTSRLGKRINDLAPIGHKISCWSRQNTFNTEIEQQWQQNQNEISEEEFVHTLNFLCDLQKPSKTKPFDDTHTTFDRSYESLTDVADSTDDSEQAWARFETEPNPLRWSLESFETTDKLQGRTGCRSRIWRQPRITEYKEEDTEDK